MEEHNHNHAPDPEAAEHTHHKKQPKQLSVPMAIVLGAFIIAIAIIVVRMPTRTAKVDADGIDAETVASMVKHVIETKNQTPVSPLAASDHVRGAEHGKITMIEYSDLECPFCKNFQATMNKVMDEYGKKVTWAYRHFPLDCIDNTSDSCTPLHPKARHEAIAAECAFEQGGNEAFWKYTDTIFAITPSNNRLDPMQLTDTAKKLNLDLEQFTNCLSSDKYANVVSADAKKGLLSNVKGTPNTIIVDSLGNTYTIAGAYPYEVVSGVLDQILDN